MSKIIKTSFVGQVQFTQNIADIWLFIISPQKVSECTPGLTEWLEVEPKMSYKLWFLWVTPAQTKLVFPTELSWEFVKAPNQFHFAAMTHPKAFGKIKLTGEITLSENGTADTLLEFKAIVQTTNPFINQLLKNVLPKQIDQFFKCVKHKLTAIQSLGKN